MKSRRYLWWGVSVSCGGVLCVGLVSLVRSTLSYYSVCGGLFPFLAGPTLCSFWDYASSDLRFWFAVLILAYWPPVLGILLVPPLVGYWLDRRQQASVRQ